MKPTLLVLAAGMGSRYGGLKQLDAMGPGGQSILDYSVFDAARAGFGKVVFVIRRDFAEAFEERLGRRFAETIEVAYAFQELSDLPGGLTPPPERSKPWGTTHAVLAAREVVQEPFAVINADDFYGRQAYEEMAAFLRQLPADKPGMGMVGYPLANTLSAHGAVNRGICRVEEGLLRRIEEVTGIERDVEGTLSGHGPDGSDRMLLPEVLVSMNFWGFDPGFFDTLSEAFTVFLRQRLDEPKAECYLPSVVDDMLAAGEAQCPVLTTQSPWFGVTYPEDKPAVVERLRLLTESGEYPAEF